LYRERQVGISGCSILQTSKVSSVLRVYFKVKIPLGPH
jgi:hypothetical protein